MNAQTKPEFLAPCFPIANIDLVKIELARLDVLVDQVAADLVDLSNTDTTSTVDGNWIHIEFSGRGSEQIELHLSNQYRDKTRIAYQTDVLLRLKKIKSYILEEAA